jgi:succinate dehydrogenase / fumarate reductase flavoprotein subunit
MQNNCAVFRTGDVLKEGQEDPQGLWRHRRHRRVRPLAGVEFDLVETLEYDNLIAQAVATMEFRQPHREPRRMRARTFPSATTRTG